MDGKPVGILKYLELPATLVPHPHKLLDGNEVPRYRLVEYIEALGVPLAKVKEVHLHGARRKPVILVRSELEKHRTDLTFSFTRETSGKPRMHWPGTGIAVNTTIDVIAAMAIYVELEPPHLEDGKNKVVLEGREIDGVAYTKPEEALRGTRIYADNKLAGSVKRKRLPDSVLSPRYDPKRPRFSLRKYLESVGVETKKVSLFIVTQGDKVVARMNDADFKKIIEDAEFSLEQGSEGKVVLHFMKGNEEVHMDATSLYTFDRAKPAERLVKADLSPAQGGSDANQSEESER